MSLQKGKQFLVEFGDAFYYRCLQRELHGCASVLDVGCGANSPLRKVKGKFRSEGVDLYRPSLKKSRQAKIHDRYRLSDVRKIDKLYKAKSFDAVIALDLVEHLKKGEGLALLKKMEKIARKKVIVMTPNGFTKQDPLEGNPHQVHQSGWRVKDFEKQGYRVYGLRGLKFIRGECATIKFRPWIFWGAIASLSELVLYFFPKIAYQLLAVKEFNGEV
jgi:2-polyprenyl-3-methyl-5-hydroxy-6-metoxy-1,4-benzoquinol methylase